MLDVHTGNVLLIPDVQQNEVVELGEVFAVDARNTIALKAQNGEGGNLLEVQFGNCRKTPIRTQKSGAAVAITHTADGVIAAALSDLTAD